MADVEKPNHSTRYPFASVDLSSLPPPQVIRGMDYEKILKERLAELEKLFVDFGIPFNVGALETDPSAIHQQEDAYRELLDIAAINDAAISNMVAYATGANLDNLAALLGLRRLVITPATATTPAVYQTDQELRGLMRVALDGQAIGLTGGSYKLIALQAATEVKDVSIVRTSPGHITVVLLGRGPDGKVDEATTIKVNNAIQADKGAQLTDIVSVRSCTPSYYDIVIDAVIPPGPSKEDIRQASYNALRKYTDDLKIGEVIRTSALVAVGRVHPIIRFELVEPKTHLDPDPYHVMIARNITVNITSEVL